MMHALRFDKICKLYANLFGKENIKVLPYEMLVNDEVLITKKFVILLMNNRLWVCNHFINIKDHQRKTKGIVIWKIITEIWKNKKKI